MRILHAINSVRPEGGGPIEGIKQLASANMRVGHSVEIVCMDPRGAECVRTCPLPVHALGSGSSTYAYSRRFVPWLRQNAAAYDVIIVNGIWQYQLFGTWRALRRSQTPYVVFTHGMLDPWFKRTYPLKHLKKWIYWPWGGYLPLRGASAVVFTCDEERRLARESFWLYRVNERVVNYGTDGPTGDPDAQRANFLDRHPALKDKRVLLFMGRIHPKKGCDLVVDSFTRVMGRCPDWHLVMAGPDAASWVPELIARARECGVGNRITWTGMVTGDLKWGAIRSAEAFILPSHQENFGIAVAEALACGVPVLISDKVNIWREVEAGGAGLVAPDDFSGTCSLLTNWAEMAPGERAAARVSARRCFLEHFEIRAAAASLIQVLQSAVAGN